MSTKITTSPIRGLPLLESRSLQLLQKVELFRAQQIRWLLEKLADRGHENLNTAHISLIGAMDCDDNMASELARRLMISRQAVHRSIRELEGAGYLNTLPNPEVRNSRIIRFTGRGEGLIAAARELFLGLDSSLSTVLNKHEEQAIFRYFDITVPDK